MGIKILDKISEKEMGRGIKIIEAVYDQLYFFSDGTPSFKSYPDRHPNWRTDWGDYKSMLWAAKRVIGDGAIIRKEGEEIDVMGGTQTIFEVKIERPGRYKIDYSGIFEKAVSAIHEREMREPITEEEKESILSKIDKGDMEGFTKAIDYIMSRTPRESERIRSGLWPKWVEYLKTRKW